jgi:hypothetical protein
MVIELYPVARTGFRTVFPEVTREAQDPVDVWEKLNPLKEEENWLVRTRDIQKRRLKSASIVA